MFNKFLEIDCWLTDKESEFYSVYPSIKKNCELYTEEGYSQIFYFNKKELLKEIGIQESRQADSSSFFRWILEGNLKSNDSYEERQFFHFIMDLCRTDYENVHPELRPLFSPLITKAEWRGENENKLEPKFEIDQIFSRFFHLFLLNNGETLRWVLPNSDKNYEEDIVTVYKDKEKVDCAEIKINSDRVKQFCNQYDLGILEVIRINKNFLSETDALEFYRSTCTQDDRNILIKREFFSDKKCLKQVEHAFHINLMPCHRSHFCQVRRLYVTDCNEKKEEKKFRSFCINREGEEKSCEPSSDQLGYFQPVAFEQEVLSKYINNEYYRVSHSSLIKNPRSKHEEAYSLNYLDTSHSEIIIVPLYRLSNLPLREQDHWKKYNSPELYKKYDGVKWSPQYVSAAFHGIPSKQDKQSASLQKRLLYSFENIQKIHSALFSEKAENIIKELQVITVTNQKEFLNFSCKLYKLFFRYIDEESLKQLLLSNSKTCQGEGHNKILQEAFQLSSSDIDFLESIRSARNFREHENNNNNWHESIEYFKKTLDETEINKVFFDQNNIVFKEMFSLFLKRVNIIMDKIEESLQSYKKPEAMRFI